MRVSGEIGKRFEGEKAKSYLPLARTLLGRMKLRLAGMAGSKRWDLPDGTVVFTRSGPDGDSVEIVAPGGKQRECEQIPSVLSGFVFRPVSDEVEDLEGVVFHIVEPTDEFPEGYKVYFYEREDVPEGMPEEFRAKTYKRRIVDTCGNVGLWYDRIEAGVVDWRGYPDDEGAPRVVLSFGGPCTRYWVNNKVMYAETPGAALYPQNSEISRKVWSGGRVIATAPDNVFGACVQATDDGLRLIVAAGDGATLPELKVYWRPLHRRPEGLVVGGDDDEWTEIPVTIDSGLDSWVIRGDYGFNVFFNASGTVGVLTKQVEEDEFGGDAGVFCSPMLLRLEVNLEAATLSIEDAPVQPTLDRAGDGIDAGDGTSSATYATSLTARTFTVAADWKGDELVKMRVIAKDFASSGAGTMDGNEDGGTTGTSTNSMTVELVMGEDIVYANTATCEAEVEFPGSGSITMEWFWLVVVLADLRDDFILFFTQEASLSVAGAAVFASSGILYQEIPFERYILINTYTIDGVPDSVQEVKLRENAEILYSKVYNESEVVPAAATLGASYDGGTGGSVSFDIEVAQPTFDFGLPVRTGDSGVLLIGARPLIFDFVPPVGAAVPLFEELAHQASTAGHIAERRFTSLPVKDTPTVYISRLTGADPLALLPIPGDERMFRDIRVF